MKKKRLNKSVILAGSIIALLIVASLVIVSFFHYDALTNNLSKGLPVKLLFSFTQGGELSFMNLFIYSPVTKKAGIFYLPANLGAKLASLDRVDAVGRLYDPADLAPLVKKVEEITATQIDFQITFQIERLSELVDQVEGIELFISNPVDLVFNGRRILIPSGNVVLDGDKAVDYITYEDPAEESRESVWRKQRFLQALLKRFSEERINRELLTPTGFAHLREVMNTNISSRDMRYFLQEITEFDAEHIILQKVEGKVTVIDGQSLLFPHFEGEFIKQRVAQIFDTISSEEDFDEDALVITLEVLNGTLKNGLAGNTASLYKQLGYDVVNIANADNQEYAETLVIDRVGRRELADEVAGVIRCSNVITQPNEDRAEVPQVTIILGKDFDGRYCKE